MKNLRGEVTDVVDGGVYVSIADYGDDTLGPMQVLNPDTALYVRGDRVIVAQVSRFKEDLVVLGKVGEHG